MTTSRAYQAGYESVAVKLAVSLPWIRQHAGSGALKRIKHFDDTSAVHHNIMSGMDAQMALPLRSPARGKREELQKAIEDARTEYGRQLHNWNYPKVPSAITRSPSLDLPPRIV